MTTFGIKAILARPKNTGCSRFGADLGRPSQKDGQPERLHLQRVRLDSGGYDEGGAYWGQGEPLWSAFSPEDTENVRPIRVFVRAKSRNEARAAVLALLPRVGCGFFR